MNAGGLLRQGLAQDLGQATIRTELGQVKRVLMTKHLTIPEDKRITRSGAGWRHAQLPNQHSPEQRHQSG